MNSRHIDLLALDDASRYYQGFSAEWGCEPLVNSLFCYFSIDASYAF
ncbi:hypothetical protein [Bacillus xiapuensis]|nr:hypothetical protein [Bacillus xiapuensis]